jgi:hypothetical protein
VAVGVIVAMVIVAFGVRVWVRDGRGPAAAEVKATQE